MVMASLLSGCPRRQPRSAIETEGLTARRLIRAISESRSRLQSLRAEAVIDVRGRGRRFKMRGAVAVSRPALLRIDTESVLGSPLSILVSDGNAFRLWDMDEGRVVAGRATAANLSRLLPVPLDGIELAQAFLGQPPLLPWATSRLEPAGPGTVKLELCNKRQCQRMFVDTRTMLPESVRMERGGKAEWRLYLYAVKKLGGIAVPTMLEFEMPPEDVRVKVRLKSVEVNPPLERALFELSVPESTPVENLD